MSQQLENKMIKPGYKRPGQWQEENPPTKKKDKPKSGGN